MFSLKVVTKYSITVDGTKRRFKKGAYPERMMIRPVFGARRARKAEETSTGQLSPDTVHPARKEEESCSRVSTGQLSSEATQKADEMAVETSTRQLSPDTVATAQSGW